MGVVVTMTSDHCQQITLQSIRHLLGVNKHDEVYYVAFQVVRSPFGGF